MSLANCVFALRLDRAERRPEVERRLAALAALYEPLGAVERVVRWTGGDRVAIGAIAPGGQPIGTERPLAWGAAPPDGVDLLAASESELRRLDGPLGVVAAGADRAVAVAAGGGTTALYAAEGPLGRVWSSHAVAAAWLAGLDPRVESVAVPELLAAEHLGCERTLLAGVRALPQATRVEITSERTAESCFWPAAERWEPLPEDEAAALAERELPASLERRLGSGAAVGAAAGAGPVLGLTAGLDSRATLVAMRELGLPVRAFTYGDPASADANGAAATAHALATEHEAKDFDWWPDAPGMAKLRAEACWFDGARPTGFGDVAWPEMSHWIAGIGGETGRAFLYRWCRPTAAQDPEPERLAEVLEAHFRERVVGADRATLSACWQEWVAHAQELGVRGWRTLDVVYAEQRVRRWGRAMLPRVDAAAVPAFATPELQRALAWLPLDDRVTDGFARRFIAERAPEPAPPAPELPQRSILPAVPARRGRLTLRAARRTLRLPRLARGGDPWFEHPPWDTRPLFIEWLTDAVLTSRLLEDAVGRSWLRATREAFLRGDPAAAELTMWAASIVALDEGLRELRR